MLFTISFIVVTLLAMCYAVVESIRTDSTAKNEVLGSALLGVVSCVYLLLAIVF